MIAKRLFSQRVQLTGCDIAFKLAVPHFPVELQKPSAELREFLFREGLDLLLELFNLAHAHSVAPGLRCWLTQSQAGGRFMADPLQRLVGWPFRNARRTQWKTPRYQARKETDPSYW